LLVFFPLRVPVITCIYLQQGLTATVAAMQHTELTVVMILRGHVKNVARPITVPAAAAAAPSHRISPLSTAYDFKFVVKLSAANILNE